MLIDMLAALNRFISKFANRCWPFYQLLRKWKGFQWDDECEKVFQDLKEYLTQAPMLMAPEPREDLFMYLSVSDHAVSVVLLRSRSAASFILYQQNLGRRRDEIPASGEVSIGSSSRHQKVAPLLLSSYHIRIDRVSFTVVFKEVRLHEADS